MANLTVRWLGAFRRSGFGLSEAAKSEINGIGRQVAAEPIFFGESRLTLGTKRALIGLRLDMERSVFVAGWLGDAWTEIHKGEFLRPTRQRSEDARRFTNADRLWAAAKRLNRDNVEGYTGHGEVCIDYPKYDAVVCVSNVDKRVKQKAAALAAELCLPLVFIPRRASAYHH